jgi:hypothetical protein
MRLWMIVALPLSLSGCWIGPVFYAPSESTQAIPVGRYKVVHVEAPLNDDKDTPLGARLSIAYAPDGRVLVTDSDEDAEPSNVTLTKLADSEGLYVAQVDLGAGLAPVGSAVYGLVNVIPNGYQIALPLCDGTKRLSQKYGGVVKGLMFGRQGCTFSDRASFEAALREFAKDPIRWTEYRRVKKG